MRLMLAILGALTLSGCATAHVCECCIGDENAPAARLLTKHIGVTR